MNSAKLPYKKYTSGEYLINNPSWDSEDSSWKANWVKEVLQSCEIKPVSICEVGCGAGKVLATLRHFYPEAELFGYDIAPDASQFWHQYEQENINFYLGDFLELNQKKFDIILLLDVIEHVADPLAFLSSLQGAGKYYLLHVPLDLSAITVLREKSILSARQKVGHIHYFTKNLALSLMDECGYEVIEWQYSGAAFNAPQRTWKTVLASFPRFIAYTLNKDWGVRALGGETLFILAKSRNSEL